jgi:hypothetical protein
MTATQKMTRADMAAAIQAFDASFTFSKKKHTIEVLSSILDQHQAAAVKAERKAKREKGETADRMTDGYREPVSTEVKIPRATSKRYAIMSAMAKGVTVDDLLKLTGWERNSVTSALRTDVRALGFGYHVKAGVLTLEVPEGVTFG